MISIQHKIIIREELTYLAFNLLLESMHSDMGEVKGIHIIECKIIEIPKEVVAMDFVKKSDGFYNVKAFFGRKLGGGCEIRNNTFLTSTKRRLV